jgi:hypothetical protein
MKPKILSWLISKIKRIKNSFKEFEKLSFDHFKKCFCGCQNTRIILITASIKIRALQF